MLTENNIIQKSQESQESHNKKSIINPLNRIKIIEHTNEFNFDKIKIIKIPDFSFELLNVEEYHKSDLNIFAISWYKKTEIFDNIKKHNIINCVVLANTNEEKIFFENYVKSIECTYVDILFCNNNAFINENFINLDTNKLESDRKFNMIINSRFSKYKNTNVARLCYNVAHIGYLNSKENYQFPKFGKYLNWKENTSYDVINKKEQYTLLDVNEINSHLNNSLVGGIFSPVEGGCMASTEYLLAGLPVISIHSKGGRDIWYTSDNSIICDNNSRTIKNALDSAINKLQTGFFNRQKIRNECLILCNEHRFRLVDYIKNYFSKKNKLFTISDSELIDQLLHVTTN